MGGREPPVGRSFGGSLRRRPRTLGQREGKRQPAGGCGGLGTMTVPHEAAGDRTPADRNDSAPSVMMLSAVVSGANPVNRMLGRTSTRRMRQDGTPRPVAAGTSSLRFGCSTWPRIGRAT